MNNILGMFIEEENEKKEYGIGNVIVDKKIWCDSQEFLDSLEDVIFLVRDNVLNNQFNGSILGEDLDSVLSKYGRLNKVEWFNEDNKTVIVLDYNFLGLDKSIRQGFNRFNLVSFDYLKKQLLAYGVELSKSKKAMIIDDEDIKVFSTYTDRLIIKMPIVKKEAPRLKNTSRVLVRRINNTAKAI